MKCVICKHGQTRPGKATVPLTREQAVVVVKEVPAEICDNCGEFYDATLIRFSREDMEKYTAVKLK